MNYKPSMGALIAAYLDAEETGSSRAEKARALLGVKGREGTKKVGATNAKKIMDFLLAEDPSVIVK